MKRKLAKIGRALLGALYVGSGIFNLTITTSILARNPTLYLLRYDFPPLFARWWKQRPRHHAQG